jgi:hypothetical protein
MRYALAAGVVAVVGAVAAAEDLKDITLPSRYGISPNAEFYPQGTPKEALATAAKLVERKRYAYLLAHVLDPAVVDAQVEERVQLLTPTVEKRLAEIRAEQRRGLRADTPPEEVMPVEPSAFAARVRAEAERQAFGALVAAMQENLAEFPENVPQFAQISRDGTLSEAAPTATAEVKGLPAKKVFLKQLPVAATRASRVVIENVPTTRYDPITVQRWFVEDRQVEEKPKAEAKPNAEDKPKADK